MLAALAAMYSDGTMKRIVAKWGMSSAVTLLK
jgi:ABC-type amino acid transport substrate-binding protein